jgi:hypothetical protein
MPFEPIPQSTDTYGLVSFDADGNERREAPGLMSDAILERVSRDSISNVFFFCHGWKGDVPAARDQYQRWIGALMKSPDRQAAPGVFPRFAPLAIGLHWPSEPWGDEELGGGSFGSSGSVRPDALLERYLARLGDRPEVRKPLQIILDEARVNVAPEELPPAVRQAYLDLNDALGLGTGGVGAPPDADREGFDPDVSFESANEEGASFGGLSLGGLLGPLRQLSYWTMKKRARSIGEGAMHNFLKRLQSANPQVRVHLMGHSFGTIVISGMLGGPDARGALPRPVDSVVLVQGAVSLWCYAPSIPFGKVPGYFKPILEDRKVQGPIVTTQSRHDTAVGKLYPLASRIKGSADFAPGLPEFGAIGTFGLQGLPDSIRSEQKMKGAAEPYEFAKGRVYNLEGSQFIAKKEGASGAHSDIDGPEVAHVIWQAAFASA